MALKPILFPERPDWPKIEALLERIHVELSSEWLRERYVIPYQEARETFEPRFTRCSVSEFEGELQRFVEHVAGRVFLKPQARSDRLAAALALDDARLLDRALGDWRSVGLEMEREGMRGVLDRAIGILRQWAIDAHIEAGLLLSIKTLGSPHRLKLAERYLEEVGKLLPDLELTHPLLVDAYWHEILRDHAMISLTVARQSLNPVPNLE